MVDCARGVCVCVCGDPQAGAGEKVFLGLEWDVRAGSASHDLCIMVNPDAPEERVDELKQACEAAGFYAQVRCWRVLCASTSNAWGGGMRGCHAGALYAGCCCVGRMNGRCGVADCRRS